MLARRQRRSQPTPTRARRETAALWLTSALATPGRARTPTMVGRLSIPGRRTRRASPRSDWLLALDLDRRQPAGGRHLGRRRREARLRSTGNRLGPALAPA